MKQHSYGFQRRGDQPRFSSGKAISPISQIFKSMTKKRKSKTFFATAIFATKLGTSTKKKRNSHQKTRRRSHGKKRKEKHIKNRAIYQQPDPREGGTQVITVAPPSLYFSPFGAPERRKKKKKEGANHEREEGRGEQEVEPGESQQPKTHGHSWAISSQIYWSQGHIYFLRPPSSLHLFFLPPPRFPSLYFFFHSLYCGGGKWRGQMG